MTNHAATALRQQRIQRIRQRKVKPTQKQVQDMFEGISRKTASELLTESEREHTSEFNKLWQMWPVRRQA